ncbi:hypothetical protein SASPL_129880 [Salvia splendens]|uniref:Uncharacterized protein n=1 Tax=Salvia splendens TaxID=180675 RepID=A0A8X8XI15_SALSN|nr:hypothetical protein SASPL_129880 [Salvia splendens]
MSIPASANLYLDDKNQKIYKQKGSEDISFVRFVYDNDSDNAKQIVIKVKDRSPPKLAKNFTDQSCAAAVTGPGGGERENDEEEEIAEKQGEFQDRGSETSSIDFPGDGGADSAVSGDLRQVVHDSVHVDCVVFGSDDQRHIGSGGCERRAAAQSAWTSSEEAQRCVENPN